jgi:hypothetical protein
MAMAIAIAVLVVGVVLFASSRLRDMGLFNYSYSVQL